MRTGWRRMGMGLLVACLVAVPGKLAVGLPSNVELTGMLAMWMHGTGVQIEFPDRLGQNQRMAFHTRVVGDPDTTNWFHFPIATPVVGTYALFETDDGFLGEIKNIVPGADLALPESVSWNLYFRRFRLDKVLLSFRTGSPDARVTRVHVHDGGRRLAAFDNLNLYGEQEMREFMIPGTPPVHKGLCISLGVEFGSSSPAQRWMELESVGADFYFWEDRPGLP